MKTESHPCKKVRRDFSSFTESNFYNLEQVMGEHFLSTANIESSNYCIQPWKTKEREHPFLDPRRTEFIHLSREYSKEERLLGQGGFLEG